MQQEEAPNAVMNTAKGRSTKALTAVLYTQLITRHNIDLIHCSIRSKKRDFVVPNTVMEGG